MTNERDTNRERADINFGRDDEKIRELQKKKLPPFDKPPTEMPKTITEKPDSFIALPATDPEDGYSKELEAARKKLQMAVAEAVANHYEKHRDLYGDDWDEGAGDFELDFKYKDGYEFRVDFSIEPTSGDIPW